MRIKPETVKVGNATVAIYRRTRDKHKSTERTVFEVADYTAGVRRLRGFSDRAAARTEAERIARQLSSGDATAAAMRNGDAASFGRAMELIRPTGDALELVAARYAECVKILGDGSRLVHAAKALVEKEKFPIKTVAEVVTDMLAAKEGKREQRTLDDLRNRLAKFSTAFNGPIASITHSEIQEWLDGLKTSERDRLNYRSKVNTLFRWAWKRNYVPTNPVEKTERPDTEESAIEIYTPAEIRRLIKAATKEFLPCVLLGAFAGLRSSEVMRLKWEDFNLKRGFITASAKKKGTPSRRLVPVQPNLAAWLADYSDKKGDVWKGNLDQFCDAQQATTAATRTESQVPVKWKHNGLRHSFISYRLAVLHDDGKVALEAGNSKETIHTHYKELVTPDDATEWFAIGPQ